MSHVLRRAGILLAAVAFLAAFAGTASAAEKYVALGDSFSSGSGNVADLNAGCTRSTKAFPYQTALQRPDLALTFVACGGAQVPDVMSSQIQYVTADTGIVSISIGGNDVGFGNLLVGCLTVYCQAAIDQTNYDIDHTLPGRLDTMYSAIKSHAPGAKVVVMGYPRMLGNKLCSETGSITSSEASQLNGVADHLRTVISGKAAQYGFSYADSTPPFTNHDVCASTPWLYGASWYIPFHPNVAGHHDGLTPLLRSFIG